MKRLSYLSFFLLFFTALFAQCPSNQQWNFDADMDCWILQKSLTGQVSDGLLLLNITAADPFMLSPDNLNVSASEKYRILINMKNNTADTKAEVFYTTTTSGGFAAARKVSFDIEPNATEMTEYVIDMSQEALWTGTIKQLRFDPNASSTTGSIELDYIKMDGGDCDVQTITFPEISDKLIGDDDFELQASASSNVAVTYQVASGPATVNGALVSLDGTAGMVTIIASQAGDEGYCAATDVSRTFSVIDPDLNADDASCFADGWVATDALGRVVRSYDNTGSLRPDKKVGVFYYIWHGYHSDKVYDITKILKANPTNSLSDHGDWGPENKFHFWGEPEYGYYRSEDPWVIRRDLQMLSNAKVDFVFFDVTNHFTYLSTVRAFCEVSKQMREEGVKTPDIAFCTHSKGGETVNELYQQFYKLNQYKDQWFYWEGKPLVLADKSETTLEAAAKDFFTFKFSWAWTDAKNTPNHWQWLDTYPQDYGWSTDRAVADQLTVSVAHHPGRPLGTSYSKGQQPEVNEAYLTEFTGQGLQFEEQWQRVEQVDPQLVMVTQWNEWIAQRFIWEKGLGKYAGKTIRNGDTHFVDAFTEEFNRDMAPMKGGHTDNYYYQLVSNIRKFKGMGGKQPYRNGSIALDGTFADWSAVQPNFRDPLGDTMHRNHQGYDPTTVYTNTTGRNDIISAKVAYDASTLYMYAACRESMTPYHSGRWMMLFIDVDKDMKTGWEGYDYMVNYSVVDQNQTTLRKWNGTTWENYKTISYRQAGKFIELAIPRADIQLTGANPQFYFKWADNVSELVDASAFFTDGDAAPDRRFKFHFNEDLASVITPPKARGQALKMHPNPSADHVTIETLPDSLVELYTLDGTKVYSAVAKSGTIHLDVAPFAHQVLMVKSQSETRLETQKLIIR